METEIEENDKSKLILNENLEKICDSNASNVKSKAQREQIEVQKEKNIGNDSTTKEDNINEDEIIPNNKLVEKDDINVNPDEIVANNNLAEKDNREEIDCQKNEDDSQNVEIVNENISDEIVANDNLVEKGDREEIDCQKNEDDSQNVGINNENSLEKVPESIVKLEKSLVADYRSASSESDTESDSLDSQSDSSYETSESEEESESESESNSEPNKEKKRKPKKDRNQIDLSYADLPPIEDLKISVPEDECEEIGTITNFVEALVVVECYKGVAPLDIDSILFLDKGRRTLGKIFDVIGPVSEPVYTVRFTNVDQIKRNEIEKGMKVFCAPKTDYSTYVFLPDLLKMKGSDASWKDNVEAPSECQDFSDDEEEQKHRSVFRNVFNENNRRRNPDENPQDSQKRMKTWRNHNPRPLRKYLNPSRFQNPQQFQRPLNSFATSSSWSYQPQMTSSLQSSPSFSPFGNNPFARTANPSYSNNPPFSNYRFPNVPPFPPGNFTFNATPPPPPPPTPSVQTQSNSYPTRMTRPPPFSSFMTPPPGNRMMAPFPFGQGLPQQPNFYPQQMQFGNNLTNALNAQRLPSPMSRTFGSDLRGPPPPPPPPSV